MDIKKKYLAYLKRSKSWGKKFKILEWMLRSKDLWGPFPLHAEIEIDQRCNLQCPKCHRGRIVSNKLLNVEQFREIVKKLGSGLTEVWIHGFGEPTMHPQFLKMMTYLKAKKISWGLITNGATGFFDNPLNIQKMLRLKPIAIRFSVDAADTETFERERFPAKYKVVMQNIRNTVKMRNSLYPKESKTRPRVDLHCVLTMNTVDQIFPMIVLRERLDCDWITFSNLAFKNEYGTSVESNCVRQMMTDYEIGELIKSYKDIPKVNFDIPGLDKRICDYPKTHVYVSGKGNVWPCIHAPGFEEPIGSIWNVSNIKELYQSDEWNEFREKSEYGFFDSQVCRKCLQWNSDISDI